MAGPKEKVVSLYEEFKAFAFKGNVVDLAVGVIIGTAFAKIINSLVQRRHHADGRSGFARGRGLRRLED